MVLAMIVLADGTILSASGDMSDSQKIRIRIPVLCCVETECLHIVDNPNKDVCTYCFIDE